MARVRGDIWITLIGVGKVIKSTSLVVLALVALHLSREGEGAAGAIQRWAFDVGLSPGSHLVRETIERVGAVDARHFLIAAYAMLAYAGLFAIEATGLLMHKRWGEYVTIVITGSFVPLELYETILHPHVGRAITIVLNVAAVAYLVWNVRRKVTEPAPSATPSAPEPQARPAFRSPRTLP